MQTRESKSFCTIESIFCVRTDLHKDLERKGESRVAGLGRAGLAELCDAGWWDWEGRKGRPRCSLPAGDTGQSTGGG